MLLMKKCGGTPCDRRFDRRKVAIAAAAALLVLAGFATSARADTAWAIDPARSFLYHEEFVVFPAGLGGPQYAVPQVGTGNPVTMAGPGAGEAGGAGNSDFTTISGVILTTGSGSSIQLMNGGLQTYANTGAYLPGGLPNGQPDPNVPAPGNYGLLVAGVGATARDYGLSMDVMPQALGPSVGLTNFGNSPMPLIPTGPGTYQFPVGATSSSALGQVLMGLGAAGLGNGGAEDLTSALGNNHESFWGTPLPLSLNTPLISGSFSSVPAPVQATYGAWTQGGVGTLDTNTMTLTIPVDSLLQTSIGGFPLYVQFYGTLVATPVPEPSTVTLFGFGVAGLLSYAWRARRRRSVVA